ncbi:peroxisomal 2 4-dienoyl-CoA reductase sps19 [Fusarium falciforme]|uniref:2,4-dienoyl-CoA reductase [(3E)-enoyl-CoA-producing] n=1 Tax=Fusarium falciforme TaxID=195108 RepID=A0A9W8QSB6_9HYPO|nr:peroxisomal 2 4-dienoyl-CoA reductase sps19 [Fusarium falciforme]KAJ4229784.1 peroxisomal 2 4-dienoyl-CoA reductase sps19 [Fusarium falciforme]
MAANIATARQGAKVLGLAPVDVRNFKDMQAAADECAKELGGIDFVIAGAAGNFLASIKELSANAFKSVMDIDVLGSYNAFKATASYLADSAAKCREKKQPSPSTGGRIIFISATMHYTGAPFQTHVVAAKAGVDALSNNIAIEYGPLGVTSNIIAPGPIQGTEGVDRLFPSNSRESSIRSQPLGRYGSVTDIADATVYLFSKTGSYVTGAKLVGE